MRLARVLVEDIAVYAILEGETAVLLHDAPWFGGAPTGRKVEAGGYALLAPCEPTKIVAVGLNYADHIEEMKHDKPTAPVLFLKPPSAVIGPGEAIRCPRDAVRVEYEAELAVVIGKKMRYATYEEARAGVCGCTLLNDVTARTLQKEDGQWARAKGFDTFAPIGPWIDTEFSAVAPAKIEGILNGEVKQSSTLTMMLHDPYALVAYASRAMTLMPGDVLTTGTPSGIGPMYAGDTITVRVEGLGELTNPVAEEDSY